MTYPSEKLLQLEFLVKSITQCRLTEDDNCRTAISIQFLDHPEQRVCNIPTVMPRSDGMASVIAVNVGKTYTFATPANGSRCNPKPVNLSIHLCSVRSTDTRSDNLKLASGELVVKPTTLANVGCTITTADKDDTTVLMTDCQGWTVAVLSVRARAWFAGTVTVAPIDSPPLCQLPLCQSPLSRHASIDDYQKKSLKCGRSSVVRESTSFCSCKTTRKTTSCCNKPSAQGPTSCCNKPPVREPTSCCNKPPVREPTSCCNKPSTLDRSSPYHRQCSGMDQIEQNAIDCKSTDQNIDDQKIDLPVLENHSNPYDTQRRIAQEAEEFISRVMCIVNDNMHERVIDTGENSQLDDDTIINIADKIQ